MSKRGVYQSARHQHRSGRRAPGVGGGGRSKYDEDCPRREFVTLAAIEARFKQIEARAAR